MVKLGNRPYHSADIANQLEGNLQQLESCRAQIINKGMIFNLSHVEIDFTVPF